MNIKDIVHTDENRLTMLVEFGPEDFEAIKDAGLLEHLFFEEIGRRIVSQIEEQKEIITERITRKREKQ